MNGRIFSAVTGIIKLIIFKYSLGTYQSKSKVGPSRSILRVFAFNAAAILRGASPSCLYTTASGGCARGAKFELEAPAGIRTKIVCALGECYTTEPTRQSSPHANSSIHSPVSLRRRFCRLATLTKLLRAFHYYALRYACYEIRCATSYEVNNVLQTLPFLEYFYIYWSVHRAAIQHEV